MKKMSYRVLASVLGIFLALTAMPVAGANARFNDINGHWAEEIIERWQDSGYISGYPDGSFKPDAPVTRAELSRILAEAFDLNEPAPLSYSDISENGWYYPYLEKSAKYIPVYPLVTAYESNIPYAENAETGANGFLPDEKALRAHVAEALVEIKRETVVMENLSDGQIKHELQEIFKDTETITTPRGYTPENVNRMHRYMWLAYKHNIMVGYDGYFNPYGYMTRAELITAIDNMNKSITAKYLGVENYGASETNKDGKNDFRYRFYIDGKEVTFAVDNGTADSEGNYDYPLQNTLKENYSYNLLLDGDKVVYAEELKGGAAEYLPAVSGVPGTQTLLNFLKTAMEPVGTTLYIYGGGWDWQDEGSSPQTRRLGVSPDWVRFFNENDENYTYKEVDGDKDKANPSESYYPYGGYNEYYYAGLDCSGYLGWVLYNTFNISDMQSGYVSGSTGMAKKLADMGYGVWSQNITEMKPGEIMSMNGHVWISLGTCDDGSTLIVHSTPSRSRTNQPGGGVQISAIGKSADCEAYRLADEYMSKYYPEWYRRYPIYLCDPDIYFTFTGEKAGKFTWSTDILEDAENLRNMKPKEVLEVLFK